MSTHPCTIHQKSISPPRGRWVGTRPPSPTTRQGTKGGSHKARKSVHVHQIPKNELDLQSHYSLHQIDDGGGGGGAGAAAIPSRSTGAACVPSVYFPIKDSKGLRVKCFLSCPARSRVRTEERKVDFAKIPCTPSRVTVSPQRRCGRNNPSAEIDSTLFVRRGFFLSLLLTRSRVSCRVHCNHSYICVCEKCARCRMMYVCDDCY